MSDHQKATPAGRTRSQPAGPAWLLRRADQATVAVLILVGVAATSGWWLAHRGQQGRMIEIDRAVPRVAKFQVDLNAADWPELSQLPGIGETLARRIVESREQDGPFRDHEDLRRVRGIGPKTLDEVRPHLLPMPDARNVAGR